MATRLPHVSPKHAIDFLNLMQSLKVMLRCSAVGLCMDGSSVHAHKWHDCLCPPRPVALILVCRVRLQATKRTGWVRRGIKGPESIADHSYRMGLMAMLVQGTSYDYSRWAPFAFAGRAIVLSAYSRK
jgi:hypothetical protein